MLEKILNDMLQAISAYHKNALIAGCIAIIAYIIYQTVLRKPWTGVAMKRTAGIGMTACYGYMLFCLTLIERESGNFASPNWILFSTLDSTKVDVSFAIENIFLFIPYGFLIPWLIRPMRAFWKVTLSAGLISMIIEITQYVFRCGRFELDDILLNTVGGVIGYWFLWLLV